MTREEKLLLLQDMCTRLSYGTKFNYCDYISKNRENNPYKE